MILQLILVSVLLGSLQALTREDANQYIDKVLSGRFIEEASYSRIDPYKLDDVHVKLNLSGQTRGKAVLERGQILYLSKVRRATDCTVPFFQSANITFTCFLRFDKLQVNYTANVAYENMNMLFYPHAKVEGTNVTVQVTTNHEDDIPNLKMLFINRIGEMTITAKMLAIGDVDIVIGPPIREALERKAIQSLHRAIGGRFKEALAYSIYKTPVGLDK